MMNYDQFVKILSNHNLRVAQVFLTLLCVVCLVIRSTSNEQNADIIAGRWYLAVRTQLLLAALLYAISFFIGSAFVCVPERKRRRGAWTVIVLLLTIGSE